MLYCFFLKMHLFQFSVAKKKQLHVGRPDDDLAASGTYDDIDDYDFM